MSAAGTATGGTSSGGEAGSALGGASGGSGGGSSGSGGTGGSPVGGSAGSAATDCAGALLCEGFESSIAAVPPAGRWKVTSVGGVTITVDSEHAFAGTKAAHFQGKVNGASAYALLYTAEPAVFPVVSSKLFVRFMLYIQRYPQNSPMHTRLVSLGSARALSNPFQPADGQGYVLADYNGIAVERLSSGYFRDTQRRFADAARVGKWQCFELGIDNQGGPVPGGNGAALPHIWEGGQELSLALSGDKNVPYGAIPFEALQLSLFAYQTDTGTADYWIDDIVVSKERIGCPTTPAP